MSDSLFPDSPKPGGEGVIGGLRPDDSQVPEGRTATGAIGGKTPPRGEAYADVFTIRRLNKDYLLGKRDVPDGELGGDILLIGIVVVVAVAMIGYLLVDANARASTHPLILLLVAGFMLPFLGISLYRWKRHRDFVSKGQLLIGSLLEAQSIKHRDSSGKVTYKAYISYEIETPDGRMLTHEEVYNRKRGIGIFKLEKGQRIAVLYIADGDRMYML